MTESCHFNDKNSLSGSFCVYAQMETDRILKIFYKTF